MGSVWSLYGSDPTGGSWGRCDGAPSGHTEDGDGAACPPLSCVGKESVVWPQPAGEEGAWPRPTLTPRGKEHGPTPWEGGTMAWPQPSWMAGKWVWPSYIERRGCGPTPTWPGGREGGMAQPQIAQVEGRGFGLDLWWGRRGHGLALNQLCNRGVIAWLQTTCAGLGSSEAGRSGSISCHCSSSTKFPDPWGAPGARYQGSMGCIWPADWRLITLV